MNVFIATIPRSGSTLLGMMLNQHSKCFNAGESFFWKKFIPGETKCSCGDKNCSLLLKVFSEISTKTGIMDFFDVCKTLDEFPENKSNIILGDKFERRLSKSCLALNYSADIFRRQTLKDIIIDTSTNIRIARRLLFDKKWKIILLTRDPRGVLYSYKKANIRYGVKKSLSRKVDVFVDFAKNATAIINNPNVLLVKYEDICNYPKEELEKISNFLCIPFESSMLDFKNDPGHTVMGNRMRFDDNRIIAEDLLWISGLSEVEKSLLVNSRELVTLYKGLGYNLN